MVVEILRVRKLLGSVEDGFLVATALGVNDGIWIFN